MKALRSPGPAVLLLAVVFLCRCTRDKKAVEQQWSAPDTASIPHTGNGQLIRYGRALIANTAFYLGPNGTVAHASNGMNCQNCHLSAGTTHLANNYAAAFSTYPKFRERSGTVESLEKKINDCFERSMNGRAIDSTGLEMQAIVAYMRWLGQGVPKGTRPVGTGTTLLPYPIFAADPVAGNLVYQQKCMQCHGADGAGKKNIAAAGYLYPPLWGSGSFNTGAGIYRLTKMAGFIKNNMPPGSSYALPQLSDTEAWNVAAFIVSQPRPAKAFAADWPDIRTKPIDHPFGPFPDTFSTVQHKYGPFGPIQQNRSASQKNKP
ncbi:cytochrome C [Chitinophaga lutea]|uniref:Cytochrome C n=1 Tax=Chitinophaga lutea TaxID=2488634 RepID=A0A3N4Q1T7_9BACT|nr:c-type cytochrome [Chitinophaga lutea]RPE14208.1 cytochrome C [Chitinophaga lutea]